MPLSLSMLTLAAMAGCGAADETSSTGSDDATLTVFAAASLTEPFAEIGTRFEAEHTGVTVEFAFAGSADLAAQLQQGAPGDVFASADTPTMTTVAADDLLEGDAASFATNVLRIATPPDDPAGVASLADLARDDVTVVLCAPEVPCGAAAQQVQDAAGVQIRPASEESSVTDVLTKVTSGEADAGLVYVTDIARAGDAVRGVAFPEADAAVNTYPIASLAGSANPDLARDFVEFVTGSPGREVLADAGFGSP